jgi:hypothetical protein
MKPPAHQQEDLFLEFPPEISSGEMLARIARIKEHVERDVPDCEAWVIPLRPSGP